MPRAVAFLLFAVLPALPGCAGGTPHDATAVFRPAAMVVDRELAAPGDIVEISFPVAMTRGLLYVLEQGTGASWTYRYALVSDASGGEPRWQDADEGISVEDIGIGGIGPDRVVIPERAEPGAYRICTGNAAENVCVPIELVAP